MKKNKGLMEVLFGLFRENELTTVDFKMLVLMYCISKEFGGLYGRQDELIECLNISKQSARKSLQHLKEMGFITLEKAGTLNYYKLNKAKIEDNPKEW